MHSRHATARHLSDLFEPELGSIAHTADSRLLLDEKFNALIGWCTDESFRAAAQLAPASRKWSHSQARNQTALNMAFDTSLPMFEFFEKEPWRAERFGKTMAAAAQSKTYSVKHLVNGFDWSKLRTGTTIVDVGGSIGHCSVAIAKATPGLNLIVQDLKSVVKDAEAPYDVCDRVKFQECDFFTPQTTSADIYLLRWILHDYSDEDAISILKAQVCAMKPGAKMIVMDRILPLPGSVGIVEERNARQAFPLPLADANVIRS